MDVLEVYEATQKALEHVREEGPYLLEAMTYRYRGHSMGDPERYRESDEIEKWRKDDPIGIFREKLLSEMDFNEAQLDQLETRVEKVIEEAVQYAEASPDPAPETLFDYIYVE
jgi:pyruvate dehydrogenase E1 component alpha subunit